MKLFISLLLHKLALSNYNIWPMSESCDLGDDVMNIDPSIKLCFGDCTSLVPQDIQDGWVNLGIFR